MFQFWEESELKQAQDMKKHAKTGTDNSSTFAREVFQR